MAEKIGTVKKPIASKPYRGSTIFPVSVVEHREKTNELQASFNRSNFPFFQANFSLAVKITIRYENVVSFGFPRTPEKIKTHSCKKCLGISI